MTTQIHKGTSTYDSLVSTFGEGERVGNYFAFRMRSTYCIVHKDGSHVATVHCGTGYEQIDGRLPKAVSRAVIRKARRKFRQER